MLVYLQAKCGRSVSRWQRLCGGDGKRWWRLEWLPHFSGAAGRAAVLGIRPSAPVHFARVHTHARARAFAAAGTRTRWTSKERTSAAHLRELFAEAQHHHPKCKQPSQQTHVCVCVYWLYRQCPRIGFILARVCVCVLFYPSSLYDMKSCGCGMRSLSEIAFIPN